jgi:hypothetical protein
LTHQGELARVICFGLALPPSKLAPSVSGQIDGIEAEGGVFFSESNAQAVEVVKFREFLKEKKSFHADWKNVFFGGVEKYPDMEERMKSILREDGVVTTSNFTCFSLTMVNFCCVCCCPYGKAAAEGMDV